MVAAIRSQATTHHGRRRPPDPDTTSPHSAAPPSTVKCNPRMISSVAASRGPRIGRRSEGLRRLVAAHTVEEKNSRDSEDDDCGQRRQDAVGGRSGGKQQPGSAGGQDAEHQPDADRPHTFTTVIRPSVGTFVAEQPGRQRPLPTTAAAT
jgi:hypothetical protein